MQCHVGQVEADKAGNGDGHAVDALIDTDLIERGKLYALHGHVNQRESKHEDHDGHERAVGSRHHHENDHQNNGDNEADDHELQAADLVADRTGDGSADQTGAVVFQGSEAAGESNADTEHGGEVRRQVAAATVEAVHAKDHQAEHPDLGHLEYTEDLLGARALFLFRLFLVFGIDGVELRMVQERDQKCRDNRGRDVEDVDSLQGIDGTAGHAGEHPQSTEVEEHAADAVEALKQAVKLALIFLGTGHGNGLEHR